MLGSLFLRHSVLIPFLIFILPTIFLLLLRKVEHLVTVGGLFTVIYHSCHSTNSINTANDITDDITQIQPLILCIVCAVWNLFMERPSYFICNVFSKDLCDLIQINLI